MQRISLALVLCALLVGCSDTTKYQDQFRGTWFLQSRKLSPGETIQSPQISGLFEWFPTSQDKAHVHVSITNDRNEIRISDAHYSLDGSAFTYKSNLKIGSIGTKDTDATYDTKPSNGSGQMSSDDARVTLTHDNGTKYEFIGAQLTVTYSNGTVDTWKRNKDQKGALAK